MNKKISILSVFFFVSYSFSAYADFIDVVPQSLFYDAVQYFSYDFPIISTTRDNFKPLTPVTNAEFYKLLLSSAGYEPQADEVLNISCTDVNKDTWYASYVNKALELDLIRCDASNPLFNPGANITRAKGLERIFQFYDLNYSQPLSTKPGYTDISNTDPYAGLAQATYEMQLLTDYRSGIFAKDKLLTRAETVNILYQVHGNIEYLPDIGIEYTSDLVAQKNYAIFVDVWDKLMNEYVEKDTINKDELLYGAISGMVDKLGDPYSVYFEPTDAVSYQESLDGTFEGIGIYLNEENDQLIIVTPLKGSPAEKAGIKPGDIILEIDGVSTVGFQTEDLIQNLRGTAGTTVTLKVQRGTLILTINVVREKIDIPYVESEMKNGIGIIHYYQFTSNSHDQFLAEIKKITDQNPKGLILDMRNNPGGYLSSSQDLVSHFIPENQVFINMSFADGSKENEKSYGPGELNKYPCVVLINEGTASASEITALALRDINKSKIVGSVSYGKGKIQEIITYTDNSSLKLSIAKWTSPNGTSIDQKGITPDFIVPITDADIAKNYDPQLEKALQILNAN